MKFLILAVMIVFSGCGTTLSSVREQSMPVNYQEDINDIMRHIEAKVLLSHKYTVMVVEEGDSKSPHIDGNVITMEDLFIKYLYNEPYDWVYRKRNLTCIIAHEICHREFGLPDNPIETHLQVDLKAIELVGRLGIDWVGYNGALAQLHNYMGIRGNGSQLASLGKAVFSTGVALTTGFNSYESDAFERALRLTATFEGQDREWASRRNSEAKHYRDNKIVWDFVR